MALGDEEIIYKIGVPLEIHVPGFISVRRDRNE